MEVGHVCVEARFGIFVGKEADVGEFVSEDWRLVVCISMERHTCMDGETDSRGN